MVMTPQQLKASILQYAMEGKLVKQDPNDEPASVLLEKIKAEKEQLIKESKIKKTKKLPEIAEDEKPFDIPDSWEWVQLDSVASVKGGKRVPKGYKLHSSGKFPYIRVTDMESHSVNLNTLKFADSETEKQIHNYTISSEDLYFSIAGTIGKVGQVPQELDGALLTENAAKVIFINMELTHKKYIEYALSSPLVKQEHAEMLNQMAQPKLALIRLRTTYFPLPPLAEQKRIAAKIEKLMPLVDKYTEVYNKIQRLDGGIADKLKQSILQDAMEGKLVKQDSNDEPASVLLEKIKAEKTQLIKEGKIKKTKKSLEISEDEKPFSIPESWEWVRLECVTNYTQRGRSPKYDDSNPKHPVISQKCVQWSDISLNKARFLTDEFFNKLEDFRFVRNNDILWCSTGKGTVGRLNIVENSFNKVPVDSHVTIVRSNQNINAKFIYYFLCSPIIQSNMDDYLTGSTKQKELGLNTIQNMILVVPPLAEQKRIVAKIEKLFSSIDNSDLAKLK